MNIERRVRAIDRREDVATWGGLPSGRLFFRGNVVSTVKARDARANLEFDAPCDALR